MENGTTVLQFELRQHDFPQAWGTKATRCWRKASYHGDVHALSTFHHPMTYRCIVTPGASGHDKDQRMSGTPPIQGVSTSQQMRHSVMRLACSRAVLCGVSLRHIALLLAVLVLLPLPQSSIKRWLDDLGSPWPTPEPRLQHLRARTPAPACHLDGDYPLGTDHCGMGGKEAPARILLTQEVASENGEDARQFLPHIKALGRHGTAAFADDAHSCTAALKAVGPHARLQADPCQTVKPSWGPLKKALLSYRRKVKASGAAQNEAPLMAGAKPWGQVRWVLLTTPAHFSLEETQTLAEREREEEGFVQRFRSMIRQLVHIFDHAHSEAQAKLKLTQLRQESNAVDDAHLQKMLTFFDDHWEQALRYLRQKGRGKHRRGSNSESGMRRLRSREKNHDGSRSTATRQHYMQIYQAMPSLSLDLAEFIEQGPQMTGPPRV
jgi:hypothetical protein